MENKEILETDAVSKEDRFEQYARTSAVANYDGIQVISNFLEKGPSLTEALFGYIDRMTSLKY